MKMLYDILIKKVTKPMLFRLILRIDIHVTWSLLSRPLMKSNPTEVHYIIRD